MNKISNIMSFTVTQLNNSIKNLIENNFEMIEVSGEVSQLTKHSSGHIYFTLKDEESILSVICWRSVVPFLKINIEEGIKVLIKGKVTTYSKQSKYQLIAQQIEFHGEGSLLKILELRKKELAKKGYFDSSKKKTMPKFPQKIGVITSETGSVIKDIIHRISDRFPLDLIVYPSSVQGEKSVKDLINGIDYFNSETNESLVDLIIIARGGGSLEDLMTFNEVSLVKKIYNSKVPVVSAVGHETDYTLCDLASDLRAPTPSAAAEMVVPDRKEINIRLNDWSNSLKRSFESNYKKIKLNLNFLVSRVPNISDDINNNFQTLDMIDSKIFSLLNVKLKNSKIKMYSLLENFSPDQFYSFLSLNISKLSNASDKLNLHMRQFLDKKIDKINSYHREISILSYRQTLKRGFAVVSKNQDIITSDSQISKNEKFQIEFFNDKTLAKKL